MNATYNKEAKTKFTTSHRKEGKYYFDSYSAIIPSKYYENAANAVVELRLYGTGSKNYACLWVHDSSNSGIVTSGTGSAGGYGYHRPSAAAAEAIENAGITLSEDISGRGDGAIESAVLAIAKMLGHDKAIIFHAHQ